jgi:serine/threonine protein kinase
MAEDWDEVDDDELPPPPTSKQGPVGATISPYMTIGGYEVGPELGRGGMGVVYSATHVKLGRKVALKLVLSGAFSHRKECERFLAEARTTAALEHPNIIQIHDVGEFGSTPFMALEFVSGGTLAELIARRPLAERRAAEIVAALADAVVFAHSRNVIHRDLKPANVLMASTGPKLGDFGVAKIQKEGAAGGGTMIGTPSYMAPEQAAGRPITPSVDVYALGAVLYECVTGRPPFKAATIPETIRQVAESDPVDPRTLQPNLSVDLDTIILKCLEKEPARRYPSAAALADDLRRFLEGRPIIARPIGPLARGGRWARANPRESVLIGAILTALLGGMGGVYLQYRRTMFHFNRAESNYTQSEVRRQEAETAKRIAVQRQTELEKSIGNVAFLVGIMDLDQLFHMRTLQVDQELLRPALEANQRFLDEHEGDVDREPELVAAAYRVALLTRMMGDRANALALGSRSLARQERFVAANPEVAQYKRDLAAMYHNVGRLLFGGKRDDEALDYLHKARRIREEFVEAQPENLDYRSELAGCLNDVGLTWVGKNEREPDPAYVASAERALIAARDHQRAVVQKAGHVPRYRTLLANHLYNLGRLQALTDRANAALATTDELLRIDPYEADAKVRVARIYSLIAGREGEGGKDVADRAVNLLTETYSSAGPDEAVGVFYPEFSVLASREDFRALRKRFAASEPSMVRSGALAPLESNGSSQDR